eukprot:1158892-Pelagomonas_calceolata.AAC.22
MGTAQAVLTTSSRLRLHHERFADWLDQTRADQAARWRRGVHYGGRPSSQVEKRGALRQEAITETTCSRRQSTIMAEAAGCQVEYRHGAFGSTEVHNHKKEWFQEMDKDEAMTEARHCLMRHGTAGGLRHDTALHCLMRHGAAGGRARHCRTEARHCTA